MSFTGRRTSFTNNSTPRQQQAGAQFPDWKVPVETLVHDYIDTFIKPCIQCRQIQVEIATKLLHSTEPSSCILVEFNVTCYLSNTADGNSASTVITGTPLIPPTSVGQKLTTNTGEVYTGTRTHTRANPEQHGRSWTLDPKMIRKVTSPQGADTIERFTACMKLLNGNGSKMSAANQNIAAIRDWFPAYLPELQLPAQATQLPLVKYHEVFALDGAPLRCVVNSILYLYTHCIVMAKLDPIETFSVPVFNSLLTMYNKLAARGIYIPDAKLENFMLKDNQVKLIDLEDIIVNSWHRHVFRGEAHIISTVQPLAKDPKNHERCAVAVAPKTNQNEVIAYISAFSILFTTLMLLASHPDCSRIIIEPNNTAQVTADVVLALLKYHDEIKYGLPKRDETTTTRREYVAFYMKFIFAACLQQLDPANDLQSNAWLAILHNVESTTFTSGTTIKGYYARGVDKPLEEVLCGFADKCLF